MSDKKVFYYCDRKACESCSNPDFARDHDSMTESIAKSFGIPPAVFGFMFGNEDYKKQFDAYLDSFTVHPRSK